MNERIREIAEQCGIKYGSSVNYFYSKSFDGVTHADLEKFALLVVNECVDVLNHRFMGDLNREDMEVRRCTEYIKQHFGVE